MSSAVLGEGRVRRLVTALPPPSPPAPTALPPPSPAVSGVPPALPAVPPAVATMPPVVGAVAPAVATPSGVAAAPPPAATPLLPPAATPWPPPAATPENASEVRSDASDVPPPRRGGDAAQDVSARASEPTRELPSPPHVREPAYAQSNAPAYAQSNAQSNGGYTLVLTSLALVAGALLLLLLCCLVGRRCRRCRPQLRKRGAVHGAAITRRRTVPLRDLSTLLEHPRMCSGTLGCGSPCFGPSEPLSQK